MIRYTDKLWSKGDRPRAGNRCPLLKGQIPLQVRHKNNVSILIAQS